MIRDSCFPAVAEDAPIWNPAPNLLRQAWEARGFTQVRVSDCGTRVLMLNRRGSPVVMPADDRALARLVADVLGEGDPS